MSRWVLRISIALLSCCVVGPSASAQANAPDSVDAVLADCRQPDLPQSAVDSCLERARILDETNPSPQLQTLEAQLEHRPATGGPQGQTSGPQGQADRPPTTIGSGAQSEAPPAPEAYTPYRAPADPSPTSGEREDPSGMGGGEPPVQDPDSGSTSPGGNPNSSGPNPE